MRVAAPGSALGPVCVQGGKVMMGCRRRCQRQTCLFLLAFNKAEIHYTNCYKLVEFTPAHTHTHAQQMYRVFVRSPLHEKHQATCIFIFEHFKYRAHTLS